jgi:hypothetical protein
MESNSEPFNEDNCEAVGGVMAGPENASQGKKWAPARNTIGL